MIQTRKILCSQIASASDVGPGKLNFHDFYNKRLYLPPQSIAGIHKRHIMFLPMYGSVSPPALGTGGHVQINKAHTLGLRQAIFLFIPSNLIS